MYNKEFRKYKNKEIQVEKKIIFLINNEVTEFFELDNLQNKL